MTTIDVRVTRYSVVDDALVETESIEQMEVERFKGRYEWWLGLVGGPQSMPFDKVPEAIERGGWSAQAGTAPCKVDGVWGGRNYPALFVPAAELRLAYAELQADG